MNIKQLYARKRMLESLLQKVAELPEDYPHRAEFRGRVLFAIKLEKRGQHDEVNRLISEFHVLIKEELGR